MTQWFVVFPRRSLILKITPIREHVPILPCAGHTVFPEKGVAVVMRKGRLEEKKGEIGPKRKREGGKGLDVI